MKKCLIFTIFIILPLVSKGSEFFDAVINPYDTSITAIMIDPGDWDHPRIKKSTIKPEKTETCLADSKNITHVTEKGLPNLTGVLFFTIIVPIASAILVAKLATILSPRKEFL